jgi:hypothetical protein
MGEPVSRRDFHFPSLLIVAGRAVPRRFALQRLGHIVMPQLANLCGAGATGVW